MTPSAAIIGIGGLTLGADEAAFLREADPWGVILFGRNIDSPDQVAALTDAVRMALGREAPILIDQEGGRVQRLRRPHWREWRTPLATVEAARDPRRAMWLRARLIADELRGVGIDVNCVPTADVARAETHPFLKSRCYGYDPETVIAAARGTAEGCLAGGVLPVMKHMPGHGRGRADSHHELPVVRAARGELETDFAPFRALNDLPLGMTAHVVFTDLGDGPATTDPGLIWTIREEIGFDGLLMSDDLGMNALGGTIAARTRAAIEAGCDIALFGNGGRDDNAGCIAAAGPMGADALRRAEAALARRRLPELADIDALEFELSEVVDGEVYG
ncbi:glycoside hydrolase family 3 N-terminal domain-containing protein [Palleronia sediminis]|uniref:glycoside hydrolase family 3 N-terminal domain-containing protein n=1 Tax=Palleronia sediminis TaxID=2547833 RepID=UPI0026BBC71B